MKRERAEREAAQQNRNEHTEAYHAWHAGRNRWQVRRREADGSATVIAS
jgi:hypothetical protein